MSKQMWEIKQRAETPEALSIYIYGDVSEDSWNFWTGDIIESETSANHFREELEAHTGISQIDIYINSYGGSVFEGTAIYNQLRRHPAHKTVYIDGFACSIASVIAMAGDEVIMPRNTMMMIHNMWMSAVGNAAELRKAADDLDKINQAGREAYMKKIGDKLTAEQLASMCDAETWLSAQECIEYGFADRYADEDASLDTAEILMKKVNMGMQQRICIQKTLSAQLRQLYDPMTPAAEKEPEPVQNSKPTHGLMQFLAGVKY